MAIKKVTARFYATPAGTEPVRGFLKGLSIADRKIVGADIATVEFGWPVGMPTCRPLGRGLYEVRNDISDKRIVRVLFGFDAAEIVLLHAFIKKTGKTPQKDLDLACDRLAEVQ